jgi:hypothetical protein
MIPRLYFSLLLVLVSFGVSCGESVDPTKMVERELSASEKNFKIADSSTERFRFQPKQSQSAGADASSGPKLIYDTPEGWVETAKSAMRDISFTLGEKNEGECYVARLPGAGGGLLANVNRWRAQMGAAPLTEEEVAALPTKTLFDQPATYLVVDGKFTPGMGKTDTFDNYRLLGLILASDAGAIFVKMTGPKDLVEKNAAAFEQFTKSITVTLN